MFASTSHPSRLHGMYTPAAQGEVQPTDLSETPFARIILVLLALYISLLPWPQSHQATGAADFQAVAQRGHSRCRSGLIFSEGSQVSPSVGLTRCRTPSLFRLCTGSPTALSSWRAAISLSSLRTRLAILGGIISKWRAVTQFPSHKNISQALYLCSRVACGSRPPRR